MAETAPTNILKELKATPYQVILFTPFHIHDNLPILVNPELRFLYF